MYLLFVLSSCHVVLSLCVLYLYVSYGLRDARKFAATSNLSSFRGIKSMLENSFDRNFHFETHFEKLLAWLQVTINFPATLRFFFVSSYFFVYPGPLRIQFQQLRLPNIYINYTSVACVLQVVAWLLFCCFLCFSLLFSPF